MTNEATIQDYLCDHLADIEPGLVFQEKEVRLRDAQGSDGKIDILARDARGYFVIIELKRSRKTAREGLQELAKYSHLLCENNGIARDRIRCIIVSADWNELHSAFSELKPVFPCSLQGYRYAIDPDGKPYNFEPILARALTVPIQLSPCHFMIVARADDVRKELEVADKKFMDVGLLDRFVFVFDRGRDLLLYFVVSKISPEQTEAIASRSRTSFEADGTPTNFGRWEYAVFSLLAEGHTREEVEDASPPRLAKLKMKYPLVDVRRFGRFGHLAGIWSAQDLLLEVLRGEYGDPEMGGPPPPGLFSAVQRHHAWDIDV